VPLDRAAGLTGLQTACKAGNGWACDRVAELQRP
jgi:hypothetical protein